MMKCQLWAQKISPLLMYIHNIWCQAHWYQRY